jgi:LmbE family N-acetylglucosaminyl deacetylase
MNAAHRLDGVLFLGAHPDDETIMAGGTLAMMHLCGVLVHLVCATDGRGGETGGLSEADSPTALAHIRAQELHCAAQALGADSLTLIGYEDPVMGPGEQLYGFAAEEEALAARVVELIRLKDVDVVLSHGSDGEYGHPAHLQLHHATRRAVREHAPDVLFYSMAAIIPGTEDRIWNKSDLAHLALDIQPWIEAKHAAMLCHRTQHALFLRRRNLSDVRDAIRTVESFHRHWPTLPEGSPPDDPFAQLLLAAGAWRPGA